MYCTKYVLFSFLDIIAINNCSNDGPTSSMIQPQPIDSKERKRLRDRERYTLMDSKKKGELLKRQREARKSSSGKGCLTRQICQ